MQTVVRLEQGSGSNNNDGRLDEVRRMCWWSCQSVCVCLGVGGGGVVSCHTSPPFCLLSVWNLTKNEILFCLWGTTSNISIKFPSCGLAGTTQIWFLEAKTTKITDLKLFSSWFQLESIPREDVIWETHIEHSDQRPLQQPHQHVAPVVLVIRDSGVAHIHRKGHQEELDGGPKKSGPLRCQSGLHIELEWRGWGMREEVSWMGGHCCYDFSDYYY